MRCLKVFLLFVVAITIANGLPNTFQCARYCKEVSTSNFGYVPGSTYRYKYDGFVTTTVNPLKPADTAKVHLSTGVQISVLDSCNFAMQVMDTNLENSYSTAFGPEQIVESLTGLETFRKRFQKNVLFFSFQSGRIDTICHPSGDGQDILDIKRGILSSFQNSAQNVQRNATVYETDITGNCETRYELASSSETGSTIKKVKSLDRCSHRSQKYFSWQSVPYVQKQSRTSQPLLRSTLECFQKYNSEKQLDESLCNEEHKFQPFSYGSSGATTQVKQIMKLLDIHEVVPQMKLPINMLRSSLLYEQADVSENIPASIQDVLSKLNNIELNTKDGINQNVPRLFSELVHDLNNLDNVGLLSIFELIQENAHQKKYFLDAISLVTTANSIKVIIDLYGRKKITTSQMKSFITSVAFINAPTIETLENAKELLNSKDETKMNSLLAVSSLLYKFCSGDNSCYDNAVISEIMDVITRPIVKNNCIPTSSANLDDILLSIKAIGNAGMNTPVEALRSCYANRNSPLELRLAAISAHQRIPCNFKLNNLDDFTHYLANQHENTELRITSYLATMQCLSHSLFSQIKDILLHEETNQVGSFIWTHLTNLQETSIQWKQNARKLLENDFLRNKFHTDLRKYSRNYEASTFFDSIGAGAGVESNVIFTQDSYLPKSAMFNLTLDLFGESINFFEFGGRMEGLEDVIENLFGSEGYFPEKSIQNLLQTVRAQHEEAAKERIKELGATFMEQKTLKRDPNGMIYAKIFGNEIGYYRFKELSELSGQMMTPQDILEVIMKLFRENSIEYTKSLVLLDSSVKVPTILGLPLELSAEATSTIGLTVQTKLDLKDLWSYKMAIEGKIYPSVAIDVVGNMIIHTPINKCGLKSLSTLNSNTFIDGHIFINSGKIIDLRINMPKNVTDVLRVESNIYIVQSDSTNDEFDVVELVQDASDDKYDWMGCTDDIFSNVTGIQLCYNVKYVNASATSNSPYFPLTGAFRYGMTIRKTDIFDSYDLKLKIQNADSKGNPTYSMSIYLDTPNSTINRQLKASYNLDYQHMSLNGKLVSPFASLEINSKLGDDNSKYGFYLKTSYNEHEVISVHSSFKVVGSNVGKLMKYEPFAKVNFRRKEIAAVTGTISYIKDSQYNADLKLEGITKDPVNVVGEISYDDENADARAILTSKVFNGKLSCTFQRKPNSLTLITTSLYNFNHSVDYESASFTFKTNQLRLGTLSKDSLLIEFTSSEKPIYDTLLSLNSQRSKLYFDSNGIFKIFSTTWETNQLLKYQQPKDNLDIAVVCALTCKENGIDYRLVLAHNTSESEFSIHTLMQLNDIQRVEAVVKYEEQLPERRNGYILLYYPRHSWVFNGTLSAKPSLVDNSISMYDIFVTGFYETERLKKNIISITGEYTNSSTLDKKQYTLTSAINFPKSNGMWNTPWNLTSFVDSSEKRFYSVSQFITTKISYFSKVDWQENAFYGNINKDTKNLLLVDTVNNEEKAKFLVGVNIYQHFEVGMTLIKPCEALNFKFFWDKERDDNKKIALDLKKDVIRGLYLMNIEYPNQIIGASVILLPTQVTMNVTWGVEISKRLYLKVGNEINDESGIWFGELETPFEYLEKQEFRAKYFVLSNKFKVETDVSWRDHKVDGVLSGSKTPTSITGYFEVTTTLEEITKIAAGVSYGQYINDGNPSLKGDARFIYNDDEITAETLWQSRGLNVNASLEIISPSNTIQPIISALIIENTDTTNIMDSYLTYQGKKISAQYRFENARSFMKIVTPFKGIEETDFEYAVIVDRNELVLEVTLNLFKQLNHGQVLFNNTEDMMNVKLNLTSPMTGAYMAIFKHSNRLGFLDEQFMVTHGDDGREIANITISGSIIPLLDMKVLAHVKILDNAAALLIRNNRLPQISSDILLSWNDYDIASLLTLTQTNQAVQELKWILRSSLLENKIKCHYIKSGNTYMTSLNLLNECDIVNSISVNDDFTKIQNNLTLITVANRYYMTYSHLVSLHYSVLSLNITNNKEHLYSNFNYNFNSDVCFVDNVNFDLTTSWHDPVTFHFRIGKEDTKRYKPVVRVWLGKYYQFNVESILHIDSQSSSATLAVNATNIIPINIEASYNFTKNRKLMEMSMKEDNLLVTALLDLFVEKEHGYSKMNIVSNKYGNLTNTVLQYNFSRPRKEILADIKLPYLNRELELKAYLEKGDEAIDSTIEITTNIKNIEIVASRVLFARENKANHGFIHFKLTDHDLNWNYNISEINLPNKFLISSYLKNDFYNESNFNFNLSLDKSAHSRTIDMKFNSNIYNIIAEGGYNFERHRDLQDNTHTKMNNQIEIKCTNHKKINILDLKINMIGSLYRRDNGGSIDTKFFSNMQKLENIEMTTKYELDKNSYNIGSQINYLHYNYKLDHSAKLQDRNLYINFNIHSKDSDKGIHLIVLGNGESQDYKSRIEFGYDDQKYIMAINSEHEMSTLYFNNSLSITTPSKETQASVIIKILGQEKYLRVNLPLNDSENMIDFTLTSREILDFSLKLHANIETFELRDETFTLITDMNSEQKKIEARYLSKSQNRYGFSVSADTSNLELSVRNATDKVLSIQGEHYVDPANITLKYNVQYDRHQYDVNVKSYTGDHTQTLLELRIGNRRYAMFETKMDADKIRASLAIPRHYMSVLALRKAFFVGKDVLLVEYNGEPMLMVSSRTDQTIVTTTSKYGIYRLTIDYVVFPRIWAFSILKNNDNFISFALHDNSNKSHVDIKGRLEAPNILTNYPQLIFQYKAHKQIANLLHFTVLQQTKPLIYVGWKNRNGGNHFNSWFKFQSPVEFLQYFEQQIILSNQSSIVANYHLLTTRYNKRQEYLTSLQLPKNIHQDDTKLNIIYPCSVSNNNCSLIFHSTKTNVNFYWTSPFEDWKNISISGEFKGNFSHRTVNLHLEKNMKYVTLNWLGSIQSDKAISNFGIDSNGHDILKWISLDLEYLYYRSVKANYQIAGAKNELEISLENTDTSKAILAFLTAESALIENCRFFATYNHVNGVSTISSNFEMNQREIFEFQTEFASNHFERDTINGYFKFDDVNLIDYSIGHNLQKNHHKATFKFDCNVNSTVLIYIINPIIFAASVDASVGHRDASFKVSKTDKHLHYPYADFIPDKTSEYGLTWSLKKKQNLFSGELIFNCNGLMYSSSYVYRNNFTDFVSHFKLLTTVSKMEILIDAHNNKKQSSGNLVVDTPIFEPIRFNSRIIHDSRSLESIHQLGWGDEQRIILRLDSIYDVLKKSLNFNCTTTFSETLFSNLEYQRINNRHDVVLGCTYGSKEVYFHTSVVPESSINAEIKSPFPGYTTATFSASVDKLLKTIEARFEKEILLAEFNGSIDLVTNNLYEANLVIKDPTDLQNGIVAQAVFKLDRENMKGLVRISWINDLIDLGISYDPEALSFQLKSDLESIKNITLTGMYTNEIGDHLMKAEGEWNHVPIKFSGKFKMDTNNTKTNTKFKIGTKYEGEFNFEALRTETNCIIDFHGYYPSPQSNAYFKYDRYRNGSNTIVNQLVIKTPFPDYSSINVNSRAESDMISLYIIGNIGSKDFVSHNTISKSNDSRIETTASISIPSDEIKWIFEAECNVTHNGMLRFYRIDQDVWSNATINYSRNLTTLVIHFDKQTQSVALNESLVIFYENKPNLYYGFSFGQYRATAQLKFIHDHLNYVDIIAKSPYNGIKEFNVLADIKGNARSVVKLVYNENYVEAVLQNALSDVLNTQLALNISSEYYVFGAKSKLHQNDAGFSADLLTGSGDTVYSNMSIFYVNNEEKFELNSTCVVDNIIDNEESITIHKNLNKIYITTNSFLMSYSNTENAVGYYILYNGTEKHYAFIKLCRERINFNFNTSLLTDREIKISLDNSDPNRRTQVLKVLSEDSTLLSTQIFSIFSDDTYEIQANFEILQTDMFKIRSILTLGDNVTGDVIITDCNHNDHSLHIVYSTQDRFLAELDLVSVSLPDDGFTIQMNINQMPNFTFFVGSRLYGNKYNTFIHCISERDPQAYRLQLTVPTSRYLKSVDFSIDWLLRDNYLLNQNLVVSSDVIGEVRTKVDCRVNDLGLFLEMDLQLPFMDQFEKFHALLELPKYFRPKFELVLPNGKKYGLHFAHNINGDIVLVKLGYLCDVRKFDINVDVIFSEYKLFVEAHIPSENIKYVKASLNTQKTNEGNLNTIAYNDQTYQLGYNLINENEHKVISLLLVTPRLGYDKYFIDLEWKMYPDKALRAWLFYPALEKPVGFYYVMSFFNAFTFKMRTALVLPLPIYGLDHFELSILDELSNTNSEGILYVLECSSKSNLHNISINVDAVDIGYFRQLLVGITMNKDTFNTNIVSIGPSIDDLKFFIDLNTTYLDVGSVNIFLNSSVDLERGIQSGIIYNKEDIINFYFQIKDRLLIVVVKNVWKPVSLQYKYVNEEGEFSAIGIVCYNLLNEDSSTLGGSLILTSNITTYLYLPSRRMSFLFQKERSISKMYYLNQLSWNQNDTIRLELNFLNKTISKMTNLHHSIIMEFPFNRFEVMQKADINFNALSMNSTNKFIWGLERSEISLHNKLEPGKLHSRLIATPLINPIVVVVDMSKFHNIPSSFKASMQYSNDKNKLIELEMFYNKKVGPIETLATERKFVFKHPASKVDHTLYFSTLRTNEYTSGKTIINYYNYVLNQSDTLTGSIYVWHEKFKVRGDIETNQNTMSIGAEASNERDRQTLKIRSQLNNKEPLQMECIYDYSKDSPSVNIKTNYGSAKKYDFYIGQPSNREFRTHLQHEIYEDSYSDAMFALKLNSSQLLWVKVQWANELLPTFHRAILEEYSDLRYIVEATGKQLIDILDDEIGRVLLHDLSDVKKNISDYYEEKLLATLDGRLTRYIVNNYNANAFYSKRIQSLLTYLKEYQLYEKIVNPIMKFVWNIYSTLKSTLSDFLHSVKRVISITSEIVEAIVKDISDVKRLKVNAKQLLKEGINKARQSLKDMEEVAIKLLDQLNECANNFRANVENFFDPCLSLLDDFIQYIEAQLTLFQIALMDTIDTIQQYLRNLREMKEMLQVYIAYINWLEDLHISTILEPIGDILEKILDTIIRDVKHTFEHYKPYIEAVTEATFGNYNAIKQLPPVAEFKEAVNKIYQKTIWIWNYNNMTDIMKTMIHKFSTDLDDCLAYILDYDNIATNDFEYVVGQAGYMIKPEAGIIEIAQPLPVEWEAFDKWPKFEQLYIYKKIMKIRDQLYKIFRYRYEDFIKLGDVIKVLQSYIDDLSSISLQPPINNMGMIVGQSHFITFNGKHYDFLGEHSYLLASDFVHNSFSIVINYDREQPLLKKRSLSVHIKHNVVEIFRNFTVTLNTAKTDLPIVLDGEAYVIRENDNIMVKVPKKFNIHCNMRYDYCTVELTGWLFGKTAGLLGTMDNEEESDMLLPNGSRTKDVDEFTQSWRVGNHSILGNGASNSTVGEVSPFKSLLMSNLCKAFFEEVESPLSQCFQKVYPEPFYELCTNDQTGGDDASICVAIVAYKEMCGKERIYFDIPHMCLQCITGDTTINANQEKIYDGHNPKSVDVVFIKQANCENENYDLNNLPTILENTFNAAGFSNNRYAFVTYASRIFNKPLVKTFNSQIWTNADSLQVTTSSEINNSSKDKGGKVTAINAVNYAADNLNFRPGVLNMFILLHCGKTLEIENSAEIFTKLSDKDIILHVLKSKPFVNDAAQVLGLNANTYVINLEGELQTSNRTVEIIDNIRDMHNELALGTNGTVADIDGFIERPAFGRSWSSLVAQSLRRSPCQRCRCVEGRRGFGNIECVRCISPAEYESHKPKFAADDN